MRKATIRLGTMFFAVAALSLPMCAQGNNGDRILRADIPFEFTMGKGALPAGHYEIRVEHGQALVSFIGSDRHGSVVLSLPETLYPPDSQQPSLTFDHYGDQYFLAQIRTSDSARMIPTNQAERELQKNAAALGRNRVVIAMR